MKNLSRVKMERVQTLVDSGINILNYIKDRSFAYDVNVNSSSCVNNEGSYPYLTCALIVNSLGFSAISLDSLSKLKKILGAKFVQVVSWPSEDVHINFYFD